jgi:hypothetical protein
LPSRGGELELNAQTVQFELEGGRVQESARGRPMQAGRGDVMVMVYELTRERNRRRKRGTMKREVMGN